MIKICAAAVFLAFLTPSHSGAQETPAKTSPRPASEKPSAGSATDAKGQPIATQIYSDQASFDTAKRVVVFSGHGRVFDPRFNIQSDKLRVFIHKEEGEGLE